MIKGHPQTDGDALFCTRSAPRGRVVGRMQYAPTCTRPNLAGIPDAPLQTVGFSFPPSLTAEETADVTQAEDKAADRNGCAAKQ